MIICFSGTGNSRRVADELQDILGDEIVRFPPGLMREPKRIRVEVDDDRVIWVLPVHCWGMPNIVDDVLRNAVVTADGPLIHYLVCTCGDDIGYADHIWRKLITGRGWRAASAWSIQMPNTYTFMRGFDVDTDTVAQAKLEAAYPRIQAIADLISEGSTDTVDVVRGSFPWVKSYVIRPWFKHFKTKTRPFHATDKCVACGICVRNCPMGVIKMDDGKPKWLLDHCVMCSRCYNCCPEHAIEYGSATQGKGQYVCPGFSINYQSTLVK